MLTNSTSRPAIILGSSRGDGNTAKILQFLNRDNQFSIYNLLEYDISYYDYKNENIGDDYIKLMEEISSKHQHIIIATPVYWYCMSAIVKCFLDRFTDLITIRKDIGYRLKTMQLSVISCSNADDLNPGFIEPFVASAEYLSMQFAEHIHTWVDNEAISQNVKTRIEKFKLIF